ncbi:hypothetical protein BV20DRAFT_1052819 [Pilatotrama ljubarskyi]|nr:hypothetical protein BV20DRAFT_1052819 [Pilatotrama ljubarskyi]
MSRLAVSGFFSAAASTWTTTSTAANKAWVSGAGAGAGGEMQAVHLSKTGGPRAITDVEGGLHNLRKLHTEEERLGPHIHSQVKANEGLQPLQAMQGTLWMSVPQDEARQVSTDAHPQSNASLTVSASKRLNGQTYRWSKAAKSIGGVA